MIMHRTLAVLSALSVLSVLPLAAQDKPKEKQLKVVGDFGYVNASGNSSVTTLNLGEKISWRTKSAKVSLDEYASYVYGKTDGTESANRLGIGGRLNYHFSPRLAAFGGLDFDYDHFAGIDNRFQEPIGLSWLALDAPKNKLTLEGGVNFVQVTFTELQDDGQFDHQYATARAAGTYKWLFTEKGYFQLFGEYLPALETGIGYRMNGEAAIVAPVKGILALKVGYLVRYNSLPPAGFKTTDRTFTTGLQASF
jgi:putative salt-induced outer membrane protein